jgi:hypothetical protein
MFQLTLKDESGILSAVVYDKEGETLFNGLPPTNLYQNNISLGLVQKKLAKLQEPTALMDCCIRSYVTANSQRKFQIFDTTITL